MIELDVSTGEKENLHFKIAGHYEKINNLNYMRDIAVGL